MLAPAAYHWNQGESCNIVTHVSLTKGPEIPYLYATFADCKSVAAQVHFETMSVAVSPILIERPAEMKCSLVSTVPSLMWSYSVISRQITAKTTPSTTTMR